MDAPASDYFEMTAICKLGDCRLNTLSKGNRRRNHILDCLTSRGSLKASANHLRAPCPFGLTNEQAPDPGSVRRSPPFKAGTRSTTDGGARIISYQDDWRSREDSNFRPSV